MAMTSVNLDPLKFNTTLRFYTLGGIFWRQLFSARDIQKIFIFRWSQKWNIFKQKKFWNSKNKTDQKSSEIIREDLAEILTEDWQRIYQGSNLYLIWKTKISLIWMNLYRRDINRLNLILSLFIYYNPFSCYIWPFNLLKSS